MGWRMSRCQLEDGGKGPSFYLNVRVSTTHSEEATAHAHSSSLLLITEQTILVVPPTRTNSIQPSCNLPNSLLLDDPLSFYM